MPSFDKKFNKNHLIGSNETRHRKFDPETFFHSIVDLSISDRNYAGTLNEVWYTLRNITDVPYGSALSQFRERVSFSFFREKFESLINSYEPHRKTWRRLRVYATDADQYSLPASDDVISGGYRGYPCKDGNETHYPRMYVVHCVDAISGVTKDFRFSPDNLELQWALEIATSLESHSVTLYDRFYFCRDLIKAHSSSSSYFFARCKVGETVLTEIREFTQSHSKKKKVIVNEHPISLLKIKNPETGEEEIFATNLPEKYLKNNRVDELYSLRWGVETNHRDLTETMKIEKWHSKKLNGILQEIYAMLWAANIARIQIAGFVKQKDSISPECRKYKTINFKAIMEFLAKHLLLYVKKRSKRILRALKFLMERTAETRERLSRKAPKVVKYEAKRFPSATMVPRRS